MTDFEGPRSFLALQRIFSELEAARVSASLPNFLGHGSPRWGC
jgi:hypothetical protein